MNDILQGLTNIIKSFVKQNKKRNIPIVLAVMTIAFLFFSYQLAGLFNKVIAPGPYSFKLFMSNKDDYGRMLGYVAMSMAYFYGIYIYFVGVKEPSSTNDLGSAKLGNVKSFEGLLGDDGLLLSKQVQLSAKACWEHVAIVGPTGAGKSTTFFIPNLMNLPPECSMVISDPKGELYQKTAAYNESIGRKCILFAPLEPQHSAKYNPIEIASDITEVREIAQNLLINGANAVALATGKQGGGDSEWINMAVPLWSAALIFCKQQGGKIGNISSALNLILEKDQKELELLLAHYSPEVRAQYNIFKQAAGSEKTAASIKTVLASNLQLFTDPNIINVTEKSEFHPYILKDQPTAIYIMCPERRSSYASPFMSCFYSQLINKLMEYKGNDLPVYMLLDEFANIGIIPNFAQLAATCRSRKLSLTIGIQGIEQLWQNYGRETGDNILNNLKSKIFYPGLAHTTAQVASQLCGFTTVETESKSKSEKSSSSSTSYQRRELLDSDEIRRMDSEELLLVLHNRPPMKDIQNKYYKDKKFLSREKLIDLPIKDGWKPTDSTFTNSYEYLK